MKTRFQKIIICTIGLIYFSTSSAFSQTIFNSNSNDSIKIKVSQVEHKGMTLEFIDLKSNTSDTVVHIHEIVAPKKIRDIQFDSEACGFVLETKSYFAIYALSQVSVWLENKRPGTFPGKKRTEESWIWRIQTT